MMCYQNHLHINAPHCFITPARSGLCCMFMPAARPGIGRQTYHWSVAKCQAGACMHCFCRVARSACSPSPLPGAEPPCHSGSTAGRC